MCLQTINMWQHQKLEHLGFDILRIAVTSRWAVELYLHRGCIQRDYLSKLGHKDSQLKMSRVIKVETYYIKFGINNNSKGIIEAILVCNLIIINYNDNVFYV